MNCNTTNQEKAARKQILMHVNRVLGHKINHLKVNDAIDIFTKHYGLKVPKNKRAWLYELYISGKNKFIKAGATGYEKRKPVAVIKYKTQLKSKDWAEKRKIILERDRHECQMCMSKSKLHVHHKKYINGLKAWEYEDRYLITVCDSCHSKHHEISSSISKEKKSSTQDKTIFMS